jgi:Putative phage metallopeptidase
MPQVYAYAESVETIAQSLIPNYHPHLATARIKYIFNEKAGQKGGQPVLGKAKKVSGALEFMLDCDFLVEVALDEWNTAANEKRVALVDHLLERCFGEEDEENGSMKWKLREPDVHEFSAILKRHGVWNKGLEGFVSVAREVDLGSLVDEEPETVTSSH